MMKVIRWTLMTAVFGALAGTVSADTIERAEVKVDVSAKEVRPGQKVKWTLSVKLTPGFHTYPIKQLDETNTYKTKIKPPKKGDFILVGEVAEAGDPPAQQENEDGVPTLEFKGMATWTGELIVSPRAIPGPAKFELDAHVIVCDKSGCLPAKIPTVEFTVLDGPAHTIDPKYEKDVETFLLRASADTPKTNGARNVLEPSSSGPPATPVAVSEGKPVVPPATTLEDHAANLDLVKAQLEAPDRPVGAARSGLWSFLLTAAFWGFVSLITPCVFPMIPITVSFFLKQSEREHHKPVRMAAIYCITIILVLGLAALTLLTVFQDMSVHPLTNILMGGLFLVFALSLFGLYDITLPQKLTNFTAAREGRGGTIGTIFMALTFTIVSFTCVAPFLGGFAGMQQAGYSWFERFLGAMAFSTTFAAPFFILALFPSLIKKLPKSGSWLNSVKVIMGFLELAAALKFFRTAELRILPMPEYFTYDIVLGIWVALAVICGLYLLNLFRLGHDEPLEHVGVFRMLLGLAFLGLAIYLAPALFKSEKGENQRPGGVVYAWIDSFLLPEPGEEDMPWSVNLKGTIDAAREELKKTSKPQFIFLDNTGVTCTNCKYNERNVFRGVIRKTMVEKYWLVQHYTDAVPAKFYVQSIDEDRREDEARKYNKPFENDQFGTLQLPLYVVLEVKKETVKIRGVYSEGKINDRTGFLKFLNDSQK